MRWILVVLAAGCGGRTADSSETTGACQATQQADVGNCFSTFRIDRPNACGLGPGPGAASGATCETVCGAGTKCCSFDGASTVRCEYCACH